MSNPIGLPKALFLPEGSIVIEAGAICSFILPLQTASGLSKFILACAKSPSVSHDMSFEFMVAVELHYIFHDIFGRTLEIMDAMEGLATRVILTAVRNAAIRKAIFIYVSS